MLLKDIKKFEDNKEYILIGSLDSTEEKTFPIISFSTGKKIMDMIDKVSTQETYFSVDFNEFYLPYEYVEYFVLFDADEKTKEVLKALNDTSIDVVKEVLK